MILTETWMDEKEWEKIREKLPGRYKWRVQHARRKNKRRRVIRGMIMDIRREQKKRVESNLTRRGSWWGR